MINIYKRQCYWNNKNKNYKNNQTNKINFSLSYHNNKLTMHKNIMLNVSKSKRKINMKHK